MLFTVSVKMQKKKQHSFTDDLAPNNCYWRYKVFSVTTETTKA